MKVPLYLCPNHKCPNGRLIVGPQGLTCPQCPPGATFVPFAEGTSTPIFASQTENQNEYSSGNAAQIHDNALKWLFATFKTSEEDLRRSLTKRLNLRKGSKVLITGAGAGNDIPYIIEALDGEGEIYAQDFAKEMLLLGEKRIRERFSGSEIDLFFSVSDAINLPFEDGFFDAAFHFGGINLFGDKKKGIAEMYRVVREHGRVLVGDEGVAPWLRSTEEAKILINNTALYGFEAPLDDLPPTAREVELSWELSNCFYVVTMTVCYSPISIDISVPHVGRRGGSMRTRYFGQLEGVDPTLRDAVYSRAERLGVSRVELIESILRSGLTAKESS